MRIYIVTSSQIIGKLPEIETEAFTDQASAQTAFQRLLENNPGNPHSLTMSLYDTSTGKIELISQLSAYA